MADPSDPKALALDRFGGPPDVAAIEATVARATDPPIVIETLVTAIAVGSPRRVAELGFGSGWLLEALATRLPEAALYAADMSAAVVRAAVPTLGDRVRFAVGDIERLPFRDSSFDVIATCWTLYFMTDIDAALEEIRRCLRPGGRIVAATVAPDHEAEYEAFVDAAYRVAAGRERLPDIGNRFDTANGRAFVERHFQDVQLLEWHGQLVLPSAQHLVDKWDDWLDPLPPAAVGPVRAELRRLGEERILRDGQIRMRRHGGAFVGSRG